MAANSMGLTTAAFNELIASGGIMTKDFLPGFLKYVSDSTKATGSYAAALKKVGTAQGQFRTELELSVKQGFDAGESGFVSFFHDLSAVMKDNQGTFQAFGKIFGGTAAIIGRSLRTLSPLLGLVGDSFNTMFKAMSKATDPKIGWEKLTMLQAVFRGIAIAGGYLQYALLQIELSLVQLQRRLGLTEDSLSTNSKELGAMVVTGFTLIGVFRLLTGTLSWILSPLRIFKTLLFGASDVAVASRFLSIANAVLLLSRALSLAGASWAGWEIGTIISKTDWGKALGVAMIESAVALMDTLIDKWELFQAILPGTDMTLEQAAKNKGGRDKQRKYMFDDSVWGSKPRTDQQLPFIQTTQRPSVINNTYNIDGSKSPERTARAIAEIGRQHVLGVASPSAP